MKYNWQLKSWPKFEYSEKKVQSLALECLEKLNYYAGKLDALQDESRQANIITMMVEEAIRSSAIEGEMISRDDVLSSIQNYFNLCKKEKPIKDQKAKAMGQIMIDVYENHAKKLDVDVLNKWHSLLFRNSRHLESIGKFRTHKEAMRIISGSYENINIHFEAPPSKQLTKEMEIFIEWFNNTAPGKGSAELMAPIRSAIAHLYFESIHPYEDGNGRIGRAIAEKALLQSLEYPVLVCMSYEIETSKKLYYAELEKAQKSNDITDWILYFTQMIINSVDRSREDLDFILKKTKFFDEYQDSLNDRQLKLVRRILEEGRSGFKGGINARKYMTITCCSKATATRDLAELLKLGILTKLEKGGRSTSYVLQAL